MKKCIMYIELKIGKILEEFNFKYFIDKEVNPDKNLL